MMAGRVMVERASPVRAAVHAFGELLRGTASLRTRLVAMYGLLAMMNFGAWAWAFVVFYDTPALLGIALLVYGLGLRHAVDADHIAAIDNVTRKLVSDEQKPVSVGLFFALGHSAVIIFVAAAVAGAVTSLGTFSNLGETGGTISAAISALFLLAIAATNMVVFVSVWRSYRRLRAGGVYVAVDMDAILNGRGLLARLFRPLFRLVTKSWHMFPLGFVFGLGFDTATEVAVFGLSAAHAAEGVPLHAILVLPALFAAGMSLIDATDGVLMLRAYVWASVEPTRKLQYNMATTLISALIAIAIGGVELLALATEKLGWSGDLAAAAAFLNETVKNSGLVIVAVLLAAWGLSYFFQRGKGVPAALPMSGRVL